LIPLSDEVDALLLDTEGLGSTDREFATDIKIFALSILLSSTFVFNQIGHITEQSIEDLSAVLRLTDELRIRDNGAQEESGLEFKQFFPSFVWVLRDFGLDFKHLTPRAYLDQVLETQKSTKGLESDDIFHKNSIRESIKNFFADLDCFTLVRPVTNESMLAHIEDLDFDKDLRPEFREVLAKLMNKLKSPERVKTVGGRALTSGMLLGMAMEYVEAINNHEIPVVMSCFERVV